MDFSFKPINLDHVGIKKKEMTLHVTKAGDRTLTPAQKRNLKEATGFKCQRCRKKFDPRFLEIHHKKNIKSHKTLGNIATPVYSIGKKHIPKYDRHKSNLEVVCIKCHDGTKKHKTKKKQSNPYSINF